jgi:DNA recombination protein RmuC
MLVLRAKDRRASAESDEKAMADRAREEAAFRELIKAEFGALSRKALSENADDFLKLAKTKLSEQTTLGDEQLESKKKLIDARLTEMNTKLSALDTLLQKVDKNRAESLGALNTQLQNNAKATQTLQTTTAHLREALASTQRRGQWGERMAEDVLRLAGFIEGVNYTKQTRLEDGGRPDFVFLLPDHKRVNMDVKFPLDNYLETLDAKDDVAREDATKKFARNVRKHVKDVTSRSYIDPAAGTVDYVLVFIPNEQVYGFIHEHDPSLLDDALRQKVVLCSPLTLYAILAVIRQSVDNFRFEQNSQVILQLLADFKKQWSKYTDAMDKMGDKLEAATKTYGELVGTRTRMLERQLDKIDDVQSQQVAKPNDQVLLPSATPNLLEQQGSASSDG